VQANESKNHAGSSGVIAGGRIAAFIYTGISVAAALIFWLITTLTGHYPAVARYGGATWVFLLMMIVLMPIVIPRIERRRRPAPPRDPGASETACRLE
jgi:hypothetical protein